MKIYIRADIEQDKLISKFDNHLQFEQHIDKWLQHDLAEPFPELTENSFTDSGLVDCYNNIHDFLYYVRRLSKPSQFKKIKQKLANMVDTYDYQIHSGFDAKSVLQGISDSLKSSLGTCPGVKFKFNRDCLQVFYMPDPYVYDTISEEFQSNASEIEKCLSSIPAVSRVDANHLDNDRYRWYVYISIENSSDVNPKYYPNISKVPSVKDYSVDELRNIIKFEDVSYEDMNILNEIEEVCGSEPVKQFFLASREYYEYGEYGADYCITFYKLANGDCVADSPYTGFEYFNDEKDMIRKILKLMKKGLRPDFE